LIKPAPGLNVAIDNKGQTVVNDFSGNGVIPELFAEENNRAENLIAAGDLPGAARLLVDIIESDPENYRTYNNFGIISWKRKAWDDAFSMFKKAMEIKPDYSDALINLFDAALKLHRIQEIAPFFKKALMLKPHDEEIKTIHDGILQEGENIYFSERGLRIGTFDPEVEEAQGLLEDGKVHEAMKKFLKIHDEKGPTDAVLSGLGVISYYQKRFSDAFTLFVESIKLNPTSAESFLNLLDAAKACDKVDEAKKIFSECLKNFPFLKEIENNFI
jgi:tetratricopeptide (TPR) repeat protein